MLSDVWCDDGEFLCRVLRWNVSYLYTMVHVLSAVLVSEAVSYAPVVYTRSCTE